MPDATEKALRELAEVIHAGHWWDCDHDHGSSDDGCGYDVAKDVVDHLLAAGWTSPDHPLGIVHTARTDCPEATS